MSILLIGWKRKKEMQNAATPIKGSGNTALLPATGGIDISPFLPGREKKTYPWNPVDPV
jgi:hypothetical protein